ncbi:MAG: C40 family peptidase [Lachnospiraceae bacterium]|nr:C40 family peptidase [Lachnospiraceae bacterium]
MNRVVKKGMMAAAVMFAATLYTVTPAKAQLNLHAGAGLYVIAPLMEIKTDDDFVSPKAADTVVQKSNTETETKQAADVAVEETASTVSGDLAGDGLSVIETDGTVSEDSANTVSGDDVTVIDASSVSGKEEVPVLTGGAGSMVVESDLFTEEEMADEFAEEEAAGGAFGYTHLGVVLVDDHLNVRASAEEDSKVVGKMESDAGCEILDVKGNMAHITSGSVEGYVNLDYLVTGPEAVEYAKSAVKETATVSCDGLKLRENKGTDAPVYSMVAYGEQLEVIEKDDEWVAVKYDGKKLYVSADYVSVGIQLKTALNMTEFLYGNGVSDVRMELCEYAKKFVGNPYVWGGTSLTKGADCSGFVMSVFAKYGISLPHSSRAQANCGKKVSMAEAKPGDLVFYAKGKRINHVGIYIGGGQIVNASSPKTGIRIANAYYRTPVKVVRILSD